MDSTLTGLTSGVVSSLISVIVVEAWLEARRRLYRRRLRVVLGFSGEKVTIVAPAFNTSLISGTEVDSSGQAGVVRDRDVFAISTAMQLCASAGSSVTLTSAKAVDRDLGNNIFCIGSWSGNHVTDAFMSAYFPNFEVCGRELEATDFDAVYYKCGQREFRESADSAYGFVAKLSPDDTGLAGSIVLAWGHHGIATMAAAYYLGEHYSRIYSSRRGGTFIIAIPVQKTIGYRGVSTKTIDLTDHARSVNR